MSWIIRLEMSPRRQVMGMASKASHGGKRKGAGRKSSLLPVHTKKLRATEEEWEEFLSYLTSDAQMDFFLLLVALRMYEDVHKGKNDQ
jgi:hypothetical protein